MVSLAPDHAGTDRGGRSTGWDWRVIVLIAVLVTIATLIYYPFSIYERQLLQQELEQAAAAQPVKEA